MIKTSLTNTPIVSHPTKILVFDSGVGGLSILRDIQKHRPDCQLFYGSDNAAFPYGTKTEDELVERVDHILHQLQQHTQVDIIVVACNTASTVALPRIRERFDLPIIGVVPAIKPAAIISQSKVIGLLATPGTIKRAYTEQLIQRFASDCKIIRIGSSELVHLAEKKLRGASVQAEHLRPIIAPFIDDENQHTHKIDTVVLACTHFPFLQEELQQLLPNINYWVNSGEAIARRVSHWVEIHQKKSPQANINTTKTSALMMNSFEAFFTQHDPSLTDLTPYLTSMGMTQLTII